MGKDCKKKHKWKWLKELLLTSLATPTKYNQAPRNKIEGMRSSGHGKPLITILVRETMAKNRVQLIDLAVELYPWKLMIASGISRRFDGLNRGLTPISPTDRFPKAVGVCDCPESLASYGKGED